MSENVNEPIICTECGCEDFYEDSVTGEKICLRCGLVVSQMGFHLVSDPLRNINDPEGNWNSSLTLLMIDQGLSTAIDSRNKDFSGRKIAPYNHSKIIRMRRWNARSKVHKSKERNYLRAFSFMSFVSQELNLPRSILETGALIYRKAFNDQLINKLTIREVSTSSLYMACRVCGQLRNLSEFSQASGVPKKVLGKHFRMLKKSMDFDVPRFPKEVYVSRLISRLGLPGFVLECSLRILGVVDGLNLCQGCNPDSVAAACVYIGCIVSGIHITQGEVSRAAEVTEVTVRNRYKSILDCVFIEVEL